MYIYSFIMYSLALTPQMFFYVIQCSQTMCRCVQLSHLNWPLKTQWLIQSYTIYISLTWTRPVNLNVTTWGTFWTYFTQHFSYMIMYYVARRLDVTAGLEVTVVKCIEERTEAGIDEGNVINKSQLALHIFLAISSH